MILLSLAFAVTPLDLEAELPKARAQLAACEASCTPEEGARAAYLVAVGTYVQEGVADGALAATVRLLDPERFATLPDVVRDAATEPLPWALIPPTVPSARPDPSPPAGPPVTPTPDPRGLGATLAVTVHDLAGAPIPNAVVVFEAEQERHLVNANTGTWMGSLLYLPDGRELAFHKGDVVRLEVSADGYQAAKLVYVARKKKNAISVVLQPAG